MKLSRNRLYGIFTFLLFTFPGIILGCDLFNNSLVGYSLDNIDIARVTGLNIKTPYAMMDDDTILVPPGTATVGMLLSNPRKFSVRQELLGVPDGKNITARQIGPAEIEVHIDGAAEGDDYALTLAMQSPDGLRDFPAYPLRIKCVSFETALQDFTVDGTTPAAFDPAGSALVVNVPYTSAAVTLGGTTVNPDAVIEIYAGTDDSGAVLAGAVHTVTTSPALVVGENHFYVKVTSPALTVRGYAVTIYRDTGLGITIGITVDGLDALTFSGAPASPVSASTPITIAISEGVTVSNWHIEVSGGASATHTTNTFNAPLNPGFYNVNVFAAIGGVDYSGSFGMTVE